MGVVKSLMIKAGAKASDGIAKLSKLSPEQVEQIQHQRDEYLTEMPDPNDETASLRSMWITWLRSRSSMRRSSLMGQKQSLLFPTTSEEKPCMMYPKVL